MDYVKAAQVSGPLLRYLDFFFLKPFLWQLSLVKDGEGAAVVNKG